MNLALFEYLKICGIAVICSNVHEERLFELKFSQRLRIERTSGLVFVHDDSQNPHLPDKLGD